MAGTDVVQPKPTAPPPDASPSTYTAEHVTAVLEKNKNANEAARELSTDIQNMSTKDFREAFQRVQLNIKDWNKTHTGKEALSDLQLVDKEGTVVSDPTKASGIRMGDDKNNTTYDAKDFTHQFVKISHDANSQTIEQHVDAKGMPLDLRTSKETKGDTTTTYDADGKRISTDKKNLDNSTQHDEYDPKTGKLLSTDIKYPDGTVDHAEMKYDPLTGNRISMETKDRHGNVSLTQFDAATGNQVYHTLTDADGNSEETAYDPATGHVQATVKRDKDGEVLQATKYDPITQNPINHYEKKGDVTDEEEYDPVSGQLRSHFKDYGNGHTERAEYDPATGNVKSLDKTAEDGTSEHIEYDPYTKKPISYDKKDENGDVVEHKEFDPSTGEPKEDQIPQGGMQTSPAPKAP